MGEVVELRPRKKYVCPHCGEEFGICFVDEKGKPFEMKMEGNWTSQCLQCGRYFSDADVKNLKGGK